MPDLDVLGLLDQAAIAENSFPGPVFRWLRDGLREYVAAAGGRSLDECLGLKVQQSERSFPRRLAESRRTAAIVQAWRALGALGGFSNWKKCELLAEHLADFGRDYWPEWQKAGPPAGRSNLRRALHGVFAAAQVCGSSPPMTTKGVHEALTRAGMLR